MKDFLKKNWIKAGVIILALLGVALFATNNQDVQRYFACKNLASKDVAEDKLDSTFAIGSFYSHALNTCVETRVMDGKTGEFSYLIRDIGHGFIKADNLTFLQMRAQTDVGMSYSKTVENLFFCDSEGVDNTVLSKVIQNHGDIWNLSYKDYVDDFNGGLPRSVQTPSHTYANSECKNYFDLKLKEIK